MSDNIPGTELLDIREYLYIDRPRVRSLLAQLRDGTPSSETQQKGRSRKLQASLKFLSAEHGNSSSTSYESILEDLHVSMFEEDAEALEFLTDVSDESTKPGFWKKGRARQKLKAGRLLRITAPTSIFDPQLIVSGFSKLDVQLSEDADDSLSDMTSTLSALYGNHVLVNIFPMKEQEKSFRGQIDQADISETLDRSSLIARFGSQPQVLTSVVSISRVFQGESEASSIQTVSARIPKIMADRQREKISRVEFDDFLNTLIETLEATGLQAAPEFPAISVVPLAIYRQLERPTPFDDDDFPD